MCGSSAKFNADSDVKNYSGAFGSIIEKQGGTIDGEGRMEPSSKVGSFSILLGKPERTELDSRCQVCQIPNCNLYQRFWKVFRLKRRFSPLFRLLTCPNDRCQVVNCG